MRIMFLCFLFIFSVSQANAETKYIFKNHDKVKSIEYKIFNYQGQNFYVPVINDLIPEITFQSNDEIVFDYKQKINANSVKSIFELEHNQKLSKSELEKQNELLNKKHNELANQITGINDNLKSLNTYFATFSIESSISNINKESKLHDIEKKIIELKNQIEVLENKAKIEKTLSVIQETFSILQEIKQTNNKSQKTIDTIQSPTKLPTVKEPIKREPNTKETTVNELKLRKPSDIIK